MNYVRLFKKIVLFGLLISLGHEAIGQSMSDDEKIAQVYGTYTSNLSLEQKNWQLNCLSRCEVILMSSSELASISYLELSSLGLQTKFVNSLTADTTYDVNTFNPLKYHIDFFQNVDQYYRIGSSNYVLKVHKNS